MKSQDIEKLAQLRQYVIDCHDSLDGKGVNTSVVKQADIAYEFSSIIKSLDDVLSPYVNFD
jgi:hypothetical protein